MLAYYVVPELALQGHPTRSQNSTYGQTLKRPAHTLKSSLPTASAADRLKGYELDLPHTASPEVQPSAKHRPAERNQQASGQASKALQRPQLNSSKAVKASQAQSRGPHSTDAAAQQVDTGQQLQKQQHRSLNRQTSSTAGSINVLGSV